MSDQDKQEMVGATRVLDANDMLHTTTVAGWRVRETVYRDRVERVEKYPHSGYSSNNPQEYLFFVVREPLFVLEQSISDTLEHLKVQYDQACKTLGQQRNKLDEMAAAVATLTRERDFLKNQRDQLEKDYDESKEQTSRCRNLICKLEKALAQTQEHLTKALHSKLVVGDEDEQTGPTGDASGG